jgi:A/G-specific adenine glycosylase
VDASTQDPAALVESLTTWFGDQARDLPWREARSPYRVWVSEVMLQQTRAATVAPYFERFVERFPDVHVLAAADLQAVLKAWEGLGYYRRARLLHRAAGVVVAQHGGRLPDSEAALRDLPGFGPYTAAAVAALAFGRPALAIDGNVRRVGCRILGSTEPDDDGIRAALGGWPALATNPAAVTEGLIELGARVCTPAAPDCAACPLRPACRAAALGTPEAFPRRSARKTPPVRRRYAVAMWDDHGVWLERRPEDGLLGGMWGVPQRDDAPTGRSLGMVAQVYSHFRLELTVVAVPVEAGPEVTGAESPAPVGGGAQKIPWERVPALPVSGVDTKALALVEATRTPEECVPDAL